MENTLKKFVGRSALSGEVSGVEDSTFLTSENLEQVLLSKGWSKPNKTEHKRKPSTESKNNWIDKEGKRAKCFKCACKHEHDCNCPYV